MNRQHPMRPLFDRLFALRDECYAATKGRKVKAADRNYSMGVGDGYSLAAALLDKHVVELAPRPDAKRKETATNLSIDRPMESEPEYRSGCTDPDFEPWWDRFGKALIGRLQPCDLVLAAFMAGRARGVEQATGTPRPPQEAE